MKKKLMFWVAVSAAVMIAFPGLIAAFVKNDAGMAACLLLFFLVNPIYSLVVGVFAGKDSKQLWSLPVISAVFFLSGTWIFIDRGEIAFILYAGVYLVLGLLAMLVSRKCFRLIGKTLSR